ncbi:MAG TPA: DUF2066 domain-containing protein [Stellaceae bacterium]|nr:DUF2066 domain-containing protein [Stellaceae bacterium]
MTLPLIAASAGRRSERRIAGAAFLFLLLLVQAAGEPAGAQGADPFSATVKVDARADTAAKAREAARIEGQRRALAAIAERLSGGDAPVKPPKLDDKTITNLVASFEVANERMSAVRYMADYTFHFRPAETRRVLGVAAPSVGTAETPPKPTGAEPSAKLDVAVPSAKPTVIVPVYQSAAGQVVLWDDPNPWREAWEHAPAVSGRAVVPLGDAGDLAAIDAEKARAGDTDAITAVTRRNGADEAVVAFAVMQGSAEHPTGVEVRLRRYRGGRLVDSRGEALAATAGEGPGELLRRAVAVVAPDIGGSIRQAEPPADAVREPEKTLTAVLPIDSLEDWLRAQERLQAVPAIRKVTVAALSRQEATIAIDYTGTIEQLKSELAKISLDLVQRESRWRLARSTAGGAP